MTDTSPTPTPLQLDWSLDERLDETWRAIWETDLADGDWLRFDPVALFAVEAGDRAAAPLRILANQPNPGGTDD